MASFDSVAASYDKSLVASRIGTFQREQVHRLMDKCLHTKKGLHVLELNCGTGEDAIWLAKKGHEVWATDVSEAMLSVAEEKVHRSQLSLKISLQQLDFMRLKKLSVPQKFDLVLSNFGGFNCVSPIELQQVFFNIHQLLAPDGLLIFVIMVDMTAWDMFYQFAKGKWGSLFRRKGRQVHYVPVGGNRVPTWYHTPKQLRELLAPCFRIEKLRGIGLFVPPSFLESAFTRYLSWLSWLDRLDRMINPGTGLARFCDHLYVQCLREK